MKDFDWGVIVCLIFLCGFGTAVVGSVRPDLVLTQIIFYFLGFGLFFLFSKIDHQIYQPLATIIYLTAVVLLALTLFAGGESRGAIRWIEFMGFRLQFSEILKPFIIASLAAFLTKSWVKTVVLGIIPVLLILKQPDLGSGIIYLLATGGMVFVSGINLLYLLAAGIGMVTFLPIVWHFLADYQKNRVLTFLNPNLDPLGASYNTIQALIAVGSGQFWGWGLGRGTQSQLLFLPEHHTDFVFASLAEELGFVGAGVLLVIYFALIWRLLTIVIKAPDMFGKLLGTGITVMILGQIFINVGMNLGIVPVTGITLPLISYGGSSILATFIALGIMQNIYSSCRRNENLVQSPLYGFLRR